MRKNILMMILAGACTSALAEWVELGNDSKLTRYIDPSTIRRDGNKVKMWQLTNYKKPQRIFSKSHLSVKSQGEYDCKEEKERDLYIVVYEGNMGSGSVVASGPRDNAWEPVVPGTRGQLMLMAACIEK